MIRSLIIFLLSLLSLIPQDTLALTPDQVYEQVKDSVIVVKAYGDKGRLVGLGSGVMLPSGNFVTNYHVIKGGVHYKVVQNNENIPAIVKAMDPEKDICILSAPGMGARPATLGQAAKLKVGERVYAVGAPQGLELSLSEGIVSQLRGGLPPIIQTTVAISPGSSGGGLFNAEGELVGITTFGLKDSQSLNFALPVEWIGQITQTKGPRPSPKPVNPEVKHKVSKNLIFAKNGNIFASYDNGTQSQLTFTNKDSNPYFSKDSKKVVFLRDIEPHVSSTEGDIIFNEIWLLNLNDLSEKKIFKSGYLKNLNVSNITSKNYPFDSINNIEKVLISSDGNNIYFMSRAWVTSAAIFAINTKNSQIKLICAGNSLDIIENGPFKDHLIVEKHKYNESSGGSYDYYYIVDNQGNEVKMLGDFDTDISKYFN